MRKTVMWLAGAALAAVFLVPGRASAWHPHYRAAVASGYYAQGQAVSAQGLGQFLPLINWGLQGLQLLDQGGTPIHLNLQPNPTPTPTTRRTPRSSTSSGTCSTR